MKHIERDISVERVTEKESPVPAIRLLQHAKRESIFLQLEDPDFCKFIREIMQEYRAHLLLYSLHPSDKLSQQQPVKRCGEMRAPNNLKASTYFATFNDIRNAILQAAEENSRVEQDLRKFTRDTVSPSDAFSNPDDIEEFVSQVTAWNDGEDPLKKIDQKIKRLLSIDWSAKEEELILADNDRLLHRRDTPYDSSVMKATGLWHIDAGGYPTNIFLAMSKGMYTVKPNCVHRIWYRIAN